MALIGKCVGMFHRSGVCPAAFRTKMGGYVVNDGVIGGIPWANLQASAGSPAGSGAIGGSGATAINNAFSDLRTWNAANPTIQQTIKIRVMAGVSQPGWLNGALGQTLCSNGTQTLTPFWTPAYQAAWNQFMLKLAAFVPAGETLPLDTNPLMGEFACGATMTSYAEPMLWTGGWNPTNLTGVTNTLAQNALQNTFVDTCAAWPHKPISVSHNPCVFGGETFTEANMDFMVTAVGQQAVLENNR